MFSKGFSIRTTLDEHTCASWYLHQGLSEEEKYKRKEEWQKFIAREYKVKEGLMEVFAN